MNQTALSLPLAKKLLCFMPPPILARGMEVIVRRMARRHPKLFENMAKLDAAVIYLNPTDLPHCFVLRTGEGSNFTLLDGLPEGADATISGTLANLINMLEGRVDGDTLFFSRALRITGDTSTIVALRNTLDREEIDLYAEILSLCGPFAQPVSKAVDFMGMTHWGK